MDVKLIVANGKSAGQAIPIEGSKFFIGRAEDCHLRPRSDLVSRHHCALVVGEGRVSIRDFGSKNGTLVNGQRVQSEQELKNGDQLTVGNLEFKVELSVDVGGKKKPQVKSVEEAAQRTVESALGDDLDIAKLLGEDDTGSATPDMDTRTLASIVGSGGPGETVQAPEKDPEPDEQAATGAVATEAEKEAKRKEQDIVGVSETARKKRTAATSQEAAANALKNFFKGRQ
jgi:pSer/pThr/pTyr-binding forkhead associated (FHA) protein